MFAQWSAPLTLICVCVPLLLYEHADQPQNLNILISIFIFSYMLGRSLDDKKLDVNIINVFALHFCCIICISSFSDPHLMIYRCSTPCTAGEATFKCPAHNLTYELNYFSVDLVCEFK